MYLYKGFPGGSEVKVSASNVRDPGLIPGFNPWVGKIPWRRKWQPTPVFSPGESHAQRNLADYVVHGVTRVRHDLVTKPVIIPG